MTAAEAAADPLDIARNCVATVLALAEWQHHPDPMEQVRARVNEAGKQGRDSAELGACMALVSIAGDLRRVADHLTGRDAGPADEDWDATAAYVRWRDAGAPDHLFEQESAANWCTACGRPVAARGHL